MRNEKGKAETRESERLSCFLIAREALKFHQMSGRQVVVLLCFSCSYCYCCHLYSCLAVWLFLLLSRTICYCWRPPVSLLFGI